MSRNFNQLDRFISYWRLFYVDSYLKKSSRVADLGCGDGDILKKLHEKKDFALAVGADLLVNESDDKNIRFIRCDISELPLDDASFDCVLMLAILEHLDLVKVEKVLNEVQRVLRPGGKLLMTSPTPLSKPLLEFMAYRLGVISRLEIEDHKHYYSKAEVDRLLNSSGFKKIKSGHFQLLMNAYYIFEK
jgi:ubiquinone/menaquinone biosynthesis C-methylase UbiE